MKNIECRTPNVEGGEYFSSLTIRLVFLLLNPALQREKNVPVGNIVPAPDAINRVPTRKTSVLNFFAAFFCSSSKSPESEEISRKIKFFIDKTLDFFSNTCD